MSPGGTISIGCRITLRAHLDGNYDSGHYANYTDSEYDPGRLGGTGETDGIAVAIGNFGKSYPRGLFVAQDGDDQPAAQNFKLVSLGDILEALRK